MNCQVFLFLCIVSDVFGTLKQFRWEKSSPSVSQDWVVLNNTDGDLVIVSLKIKTNPPPLKIDFSLIKFYLYTKKNTDDYQQLWLDDTSTLSSSNFDKSKKTLLVVHGYMNNIDSESIQGIKDNVLAVQDVNVIGVDWSILSDHVYYHIVAAEVPSVGTYVGNFVNFLADNGVSSDNLHLIGHSLGAHIVGFAGKSFNSGKVGRITGLDPALPGFESAGQDDRLAKSDATFVDCIHTCGGSLGIMESICHADFYPNGGVNIQPGCTWLDFGVCSHGRSHEYFAESIENGHKFPALTCPSIPSSHPVNCNDKGAQMGYHETSKFKGIFYLQTNSAYPYSKDVSDSL